MGMDASRVRKMSLWHFLYQVEGWNAAHAKPGERDTDPLPTDDEFDLEVAMLYARGIIKDV